MNKNIQVSGKRKRAIARATLKPGSGKVRINSLVLEHYQPALAKARIEEPLLIAGDIASQVDIDINVMGGGYISQAEASRLVIAKALVKFNKKLEKSFADYDRHLLVADVRRKEPRKPNSGGNARAKKQKSYR
jgi:small subunit ribosomal protein S9